jgi:pyruvate, water dikinase
MLIRLEDAVDEGRLGGKAVQLGAALRAGLPVPGGFALDHEAVVQLLSEREAAARILEDALTAIGGPVAVRSSAVGEDSAAASFAGQHATVLGVRAADEVHQAIEEVFASARTPAALAYRKKLGLDPEPRMGVVVQRLAVADVAGVLFTRHPVTGADERVIEASWGLGEAVVQGLVTPDRFRLARGGRVLERTPGEKDIAVRWARAGRTEEVPVDAGLVEELCVDDRMLAELEVLASRCEALFGGSQDIEFAFERGALFLLQRRAITRG